MSQSTFQWPTGGWKTEKQERQKGREPQNRQRPRWVILGEDKSRTGEAEPVWGRGNLYRKEGTSCGHLGPVTQENSYWVEKVSRYKREEYSKRWAQGCGEVSFTSHPPLPLQEQWALWNGLTGCQLRWLREEALLSFVMVNVCLHAHMCVCVSVCVKERKRQTERQIPYHPSSSPLSSHLLCRGLSLLSSGSPPASTAPILTDAEGHTLTPGIPPHNSCSKHIRSMGATGHSPQEQRAKDADIIVSKGFNFLDDLTPQICRE